MTKLRIWDFNKETREARRPLEISARLTKCAPRLSIRFHETFYPHVGACHASVMEAYLKCFFGGISIGLAVSRDLEVLFKLELNEGS